LPTAEATKKLTIDSDIVVGTSLNMTRYPVDITNEITNGLISIFLDLDNKIIG
jgi:hypothetical protein